MNPDPQTQSPRHQALPPYRQQHLEATRKVRDEREERREKIYKKKKRKGKVTVGIKYNFFD